MVFVVLIVGYLLIVGDLIMYGVCCADCGVFHDNRLFDVLKQTNLPLRLVDVLY